MQFLFFFSFIFLKKSVTQTLTDENAQRGHAKREGKSETLKNKPTKENCKEINDEPQNNVALRKVGAGKATGRACRPKQEQNEVFVTSKMGLQTKTPVSVFVCVSVCV